MPGFRFFRERLTRERSLVRNQPRPSSKALVGRLGLRRLPQLDATSLAVNALAECPEFRTLDVLIHRDPFGTQLRQHAVEIGHAEVQHPLPAAAYCHCIRCQRRSGTATQASARVEPGSFELVAGAEHLRAWSPGDGLVKVFCGECGSAVLARDPDSGEVVIVRLGAIDGDPGVRPAAHQFVAYAAPWEPIPDDGLPRFDERIPPASP